MCDDWIKNTTATTNTILLLTPKGQNELCVSVFQNDPLEPYRNKSCELFLSIVKDWLSWSKKKKQKKGDCEILTYLKCVQISQYYTLFKYDFTDV